MNRTLVSAFIGIALIGGACASETSGASSTAGASAQGGVAAGLSQVRLEASAICSSVDRSGLDALGPGLVDAQERGVDFDDLVAAIIDACGDFIDALIEEEEGSSGTERAPQREHEVAETPSAPAEAPSSGRTFPTVSLGSEIVCQNFGTVWDPCSVLEIRVIETCDSYARFGEPFVIAFLVRGTLAQVGSLDATSGTQIPFNMYPRVHGGDGVVYERGISYFDDCVPEPRAPRLPKIIQPGITQEAWYGIPVAREAADGFKLMLGYTFWE